MLRCKWFVLVVVAVFAVFLIIGCKSPQKEPFTDREPTISLFLNESGRKKNLKIEEYLAGVVAVEMDPKWPINALAAQAIMARTFTMENIQAGRMRKLHGTDVSTSVEEFQAYDPSRINENVLKAVALTRGKVVTYKGNYIKAWFSACDGGVSASANEGLAYTKPVPYIKAGVKDNCLSITVPENRNWQAEFLLPEVRQKIIKLTGNDPGKISSAKIVKLWPSGRAQIIQVGKSNIGGPALRQALGKEVMRSTLLTSIDVKGDKLILKGKGFGHGVGMCQWSAKLMAQQGKSPEEIIKFYFQDVRIEKRWN